MLAVDFRTWFTEDGLAPVAAAKIWSGPVWRLNVLEGVTDPRLTLAVLALTTLAALLTCLGLWSRAATIVLAIGLITLHHRNPFILHSGDTLMRITAITLALAPSGAALSLDRWLANRRGKPAPEPVSLWPQRLVQIQMALLYGTTVWHKLVGVHWVDGTAAWYPPQLTEFNRFPTPAFVDLPPFVQIATYSTLGIELALASLVFWRPARKWVLLAGVSLHAVIEYRFNIPLFAFLSVAQYIAHYDGEEVQSWLRRFRKEEAELAPS